jgi:hypothetical protein
VNLHDDDSVTPIPVVVWDTTRLAIIDEDGATDGTMIRFFDARDETEHSFVLDSSIARWLAWGIIGVAEGFVEAYGISTGTDDE